METNRISRREARLKAEFAHLYAPLEAGIWDSASAMADRMTSWLLRQGHGGYTSPDRGVRPEDVEFCGNSLPPAILAAGHSRHGDASSP
jgi:hypothetical protein